MRYRPKSTLEQWRILQAVVDAGGYAQAAELLNKSQSSLNHAVAKLQNQLGVELLQVIGRKAFLTPAGEVMLRRSRLLTQQIEDLELLAANIDMGWEPELRLAVEIIYPRDKLYQALSQFYPQSRGSRIQIIDTVITGSAEMILEAKADLVIAATPIVPRGYLSEPLCITQMVLVCAPDHPLTAIAALDADELTQHLQIVIRDTGQKPAENAGWLKAEQRWTVGNFYEAMTILQRGLGFCWLPEFIVQQAIQDGSLVRLQLRQSTERQIPLSLVIPKEDKLGPGGRQLRQIILAAHGKAGT